MKLVIVFFYARNSQRDWLLSASSLQWYPPLNELLFIWALWRWHGCARLWYKEEITRAPHSRRLQARQGFSLVLQPLDPQTLWLSLLSFVPLAWYANHSAKRHKTSPSRSACFRLASKWFLCLIFMDRFIDEALFSIERLAIKQSWRFSFPNFFLFMIDVSTQVAPPRFTSLVD